jgi:hypothetical protein
MREVMKFFKNIDQDQMNKGERTNIFVMTLDDFLLFLKENKSVDRLIDLLNIIREYKEDHRYVKIMFQLSQE